MHRWDTYPQCNLLILAFRNVCAFNICNQEALINDIL